MSPPFPWIIAAVVFLSILRVPCAAALRREVIEASHGAVATDHGLCSGIGIEALRDGGRAVDAAVAAALCLGVVSPASSGIGGGAFMLVRLANGDAQAFDMRETAPMRASQNMYNGNTTLKANGILSVAVPGELAGLYKAWEQHGKLPWSRLVRPAQNLASKGFKISPYLRLQMEISKSAIFTDKGLRQMLTVNEELLQAGDICHNKKLAQTLGRIAKHGASAFYNGSVGFGLVRDVQRTGGILTMRDLRKYEAKIRKPVSADFLGLKILGMPPPSSGSVSMILMLNILTQYKIPDGLSSALGTHRKIEALKHAFAVRMNLGDPDFANISAVVSDMLSVKFAKALKSTIRDNMTFDPTKYGGRWNQVLDHGTSHVSIVDQERNAISMTNTINGYFGAQIMSTSTGIILNNEMDDFSIPLYNRSANVPPPAPSNFVHPLKRPLSSMSPTIVLKDEKLKGVVGASGGAMIIAATTEVFLNHFALGMDPFSSVMAPRIYHQLIPNVVQYENWPTVTGDHFEVPADIRAALVKKGHVLQGLPGGSICQLINVQEQESLKGNGSYVKIVAVSDPRKGGYPAGF